MSGKRGEVEDQWAFKVKEVNREQYMEIIGRCAEIAVRTVFENFTYNFGGKIYLQREGGPIGNRLTMACARVVMQEWGDHYLNILKEARLLITLFKIYVDDVRQITTMLRKGTRYEVDGKTWTWSKEAEEEDEQRRKEGESKEAMMVRILTPVMSCINSDLIFTTELEEDFEDRKLPTLDCKLWLEEDGSVNHTYFEKDMRTQLLIPERSAMSQKQKMSILSNELVRRMSNICIEKVGLEEKKMVVDQFRGQLKNSGYDRK